MRTIKRIPKIEIRSISINEETPFFFKAIRDNYNGSIDIVFCPLKKSRLGQYEGYKLYMNTFRKFKTINTRKHVHILLHGIKLILNVSNYTGYGIDAVGEFQNRPIKPSYGKEVVIV